MIGTRVKIGVSELSNRMRRLVSANEIIDVESREVEKFLYL